MLPIIVVYERAVWVSVCVREVECLCKNRVVLFVAHRLSVGLGCEDAVLVVKGRTTWLFLFSF